MSTPTPCTLLVNGILIQSDMSESQTLNKVQQYQLDAWIKERILPYRLNSGRIQVRNRSSYGLKHDAEKALGFYVSNLDLKVAAARVGLTNDGTFNCHFPLSLSIRTRQVQEALCAPFEMPPCVTDEIIDKLIRFKSHEFFEAYTYLSEHPNVYFDGINQFHRCLELQVVKINPETHTLDEDESLNTLVQIWLEFGAVLPDNTFKMSVEHDVDFDCGASTFELAIIELANLVQAKWD